MFAMDEFARLLLHPVQTFQCPTIKGVESLKDQASALFTSGSTRACHVGLPVGVLCV